jgi:hypothetical protein
VAKKKEFDVFALTSNPATPGIARRQATEQKLTGLQPQSEGTVQQRRTYNEGRTQALAMQIQVAKGAYLLSSIPKLKEHRIREFADSTERMLNTTSVSFDPFHRKIVKQYVLMGIQELARDLGEADTAIVQSLKVEMERSPYREQGGRGFLDWLTGVEE